jgi:radical SAM protein with 4Fe4S-binding SPASM domain
MANKRYFLLDKNCICVHGARRAALYDLNSGDVFSIDPVSKQIIKLLQAGKTIDDVSQSVREYDKDRIIEYLNRLEENKLGTFSDRFEKPAEPEFSSEPYRKLNFMWLELKQCCNLRCLHCYSESEAQQVKPGEELTFDDWQRLIGEAYDLGCRALQFIGGEPLLFGERVFDLAAYARELGYKMIELFSNLTLLTDSWLDLIEKYQMSVATSIYGARPEIHDLVTKQEGSFRRTMKAVEKLRARNIPVRYGLTVMKQNQDYVEETLEFLKTLGAKNPGFDVARPCGRANDDELVPNKYRWVRDNPSFFQVNKEEFAKRYRGNECWQGKISVSSTGDVMPCIMQRAEPGGNVKEKPLQEIIDGGLQTYWSLSRDKIEVCKECEYRYVCKDCRPVSYGPTGQLVAKDPNCLYDPFTGEFVKSDSKLKQ